MSGNYYVPPKSYWPILTSLALFIFLFGLSYMLNARLQLAPGNLASSLFLFGLFGLLFCMFGWSRDVVSESLKKLYSQQLSNSFRIGMVWFIFSEVWFFAALFGSLFYVRVFVLPWLAGEGYGALTHALLWPRFVYEWPLFNFPDPTQYFLSPNSSINAWHLPLWNTIILVLSSITLTLSHHGLLKRNFQQAKNYLMITIVLGLSFIVLQAMEYVEAYQNLDLQLESGIYGSLFFLMTGFHGLHVTLGTIFLIFVLVRLMRSHFSPVNHFAFEASAWYWHFVDVVWIFLFVTVYLL